MRRPDRRKKKCRRALCCRQSALRLRYSRMQFSETAQFEISVVCAVERHLGNKPAPFDEFGQRNAVVGGVVIFLFISFLSRGFLFRHDPHIILFSRTARSSASAVYAAKGIARYASCSCRPSLSSNFTSNVKSPR